MLSRTDEEAQSGAREAADESVYGLEPDRAQENMPENAGHAQCGNIEISGPEMEVAGADRKAAVHRGGGTPAPVPLEGVPRLQVPSEEEDAEVDESQFAASVAEHRLGQLAVVFHLVVVEEELRVPEPGVRGDAAQDEEEPVQEHVQRQPQVEEEAAGHRDRDAELGAAVDAGDADRNGERQPRRHGRRGRRQGALHARLRPHPELARERDAVRRKLTDLDQAGHAGEHLAGRQQQKDELHRLRPVHGHQRARQLRQRGEPPPPDGDGRHVRHRVGAQELLLRRREKPISNEIFIRFG